MSYVTAEGVRPADPKLLRQVAGTVLGMHLFNDTPSRLIALAEAIENTTAVVTDEMVDRAIDAIGNPWGGPKLGHAKGDEVYRANVRRMLEAALR